MRATPLPEQRRHYSKSHPQHKMNHVFSITHSEISAIHSYSSRASTSRIKRLRSRAFWTDFGIRCFDLFFASLALFMLSPFFVLCIAIIRGTSKGPAFFRQMRAGKNGEAFEMLKFRSMVVDAEQQKAALLAQNEQKGGVIFKLKKDPRVTWIGSFLRRWSLDELPQLWNVLKGDMSLVGPRPHPMAEAKEYPSFAIARLHVKPGITGLAQVNGRSDLTFEQTVAWDKRYVKQRTVSLYVVILWRTVRVVISGKGAY